MPLPSPLASTMATLDGQLQSATDQSHTPAKGTANRPASTGQGAMMRSRTAWRWLGWVLLCVSGLASAQQGRIQTIAEFETAQKEQGEEVPWLISLSVDESEGNEVQTAQSDGGWENLNDYIDRVQREFADDMGWRNFNELVAYKSIPVVAKTLTSEEAERVLASGKVNGLYRNSELHLSLRESTRIVRSAELARLGAGGRGQVVAVVDTGIDDTHPFLRGKVVNGACFSYLGQCPGGVTRAEGPSAGRPLFPASVGGDHGTHVAGIVAGSGGGMQGVAPEAQLLAAQAFSLAPNGKRATSHDSDLLAALDWIYGQRNRYRIAAVNLSLGGGAFNAGCDAFAGPYLQMFRLLRQAGIVPVVASGNDSLPNQIARPACVSGALSVGSIDKARTVSWFSNANPSLHLLAPGHEIVSSTFQGQFVPYSGTSMAAPHVAGALAALRSAHPSASAELAVQALLTTGPSVIDARSGRRSPTLDVQAGLQQLKSLVQRNQPAPAPSPTPAPAPPGKAAPTPPPVKPAPTPPPAQPETPIKPPTPSPAPPRSQPPAMPTPKPAPPRVDPNLPLCEERIDGIHVHRPPPCRKGS